MLFLVQIKELLGDFMIDLSCEKIEISIEKVLYKTASMVRKTFRRDDRYSDGVVCYIKGGHVHEMDTGEITQSAANDLLYLPYGSSYDSRVAERGVEYYQIDYTVYNDGNKISTLDAARIIHSPDSEEYLPIFREIYTLYTTRPHAYKLRAASLLLDLISRLLREPEDNPERAEARRKIERTVSYLNQHYAKSDTVEELAKFSDMSVSSLEKNFIAAMGTTPVAYRNELRIKHAKMLLLGGFPISEVAERVGFSDLYYFSKTFKRLTGLSPGKYAKSS